MTPKEHLETLLMPQPGDIVFNIDHHHNVLRKPIGQIIPNASINTPELYTNLSNPKNSHKLKTEEEWIKLNFDEPWCGIGGVPFFVLDIENDTIRLPDTRDMYLSLQSNQSISGFPEVEVYIKRHREAGLGVYIGENKFSSVNEYPFEKAIEVAISTLPSFTKQWSKLSIDTIEEAIASKTKDIRGVNLNYETLEVVKGKLEPFINKDEEGTEFKGFKPGELIHFPYTPNNTYGKCSILSQLYKKEK